MIQRIQPFFEMTKKMRPFWDDSQRIETFFFVTQKNWTLSLFNMTHRIEPLFFSTWLIEIEPFSFQHDSKKLNPSFQHDSTKLNPSFKNDSTKLNPSNPSFQHDSKNWTFLWRLTQRIELLLKITHRIDFFQYDSKNWTFWIWHKELPFFQKKNWLKELNPFFWEKIRLEELNQIFQNITQRIEPFFTKGLKELNPFFFKENMFLSFSVDGWSVPRRTLGNARFWRCQQRADGPTRVTDQPPVNITPFLCQQKQWEGWEGQRQYHIFPKGSVNHGQAASG